MGQIVLECRKQASGLIETLRTIWTGSARLVLKKADPDGDAKAPAWSRDSRRHAEELRGVNQRMMLAEPVPADKGIYRSQVPFVRELPEEIPES